MNNKRIYLSFLLVFLSFLGYKYFNYAKEKRFIEKLRTDEIYPIDQFLFDSWYARTSEIATIKDLEKFKDNHHLNFDKYGYNLITDSLKNSIKLYSFGIDKTDNKLVKPYYNLAEPYYNPTKVPLRFSFWNYLFNRKKDILLIDRAYSFGCNITAVGTHFFYNDENLNSDSLADTENKFKEILKEIKFENLSDSDKNKTLVFKYDKQKVKCLCTSGVSEEKIKFFENEIYRTLKKHRFNDLRLVVFSINVSLDNVVHVPTP